MSHLMKRNLIERVSIAAIVALISGLFLAVPQARAAAPAILGFASNFDVANTTDQECHGFEVEIEDITDTQVTYTWPGSIGYINPYGSAAPGDIKNVTFPNGKTGVRVTFHATYSSGTWSASTPIGQMNHYGVHLNGNPGMQRYSWLCDPNNNGALLPYGGTTEGNYYPMPIVAAVIPQVVATPTGEQVVTTIAPAETPEPAEPRFPDAVWVVKYQASSPTQLSVDQLVPTDPEIQNAKANSQISSIAELFQPDPGTNGGTQEEEADPVEPGDAAQVTVTEIYSYTGPVNPEDNEVSCNEIPDDPNNCNNFVGDLISTQMVSANLGTTSNRSTLNVKVFTGSQESVEGGWVTSSGSTNPSPNEIDCGADCYTTVDTATTVTLTAHARAGFHLKKWTGACTGSTSTCNVPVDGLTQVGAIYYDNTPQVYVSDSSTYEGKVGTTHTMTFSVTLTQTSLVTTKIGYNTYPISATGGTDYVGKSGTFSIGAGKLTGNLTITVSGDGSTEGDEQLGISINSVTGVFNVGNSDSTGTILDDDTTALPLVSIGDANVVEGNSGTETAVFTVTLSSPTNITVPVEYETSSKGGSATKGVDYVGKQGIVSIAAGNVTAKVSITINGDTTPEETEMFYAKIAGTGASGVDTWREKGIGRILDDDTTHISGVSIGNATVTEGDGGQKVATLTVTLSSPKLTDTVVKYHTVAGLADAGGDFIGVSGSITILAGKTSGVINIKINGDTSVEFKETLTVMLDSAGSVPLGRENGTIMILTDD